MAIIKGKPDGGSGGKRGHSNMDHWMYTDEIKAAAKKARRLKTQAVVAIEIAEHNMTIEHFHCAKCGADWQLPFTVSHAVREDAAKFVRASLMIAAIQRLCAEKMGLKACKATVSHISRDSGQCHRCSSILPDRGKTGNCLKWGALNIDW
jgi:hypothetical protein